MYQLSQYVSVYPTAFRKEVTVDSVGVTFNPESNLNTEFNINTTRTAALSSPSFVVSYASSESSGTITFVLKGYWFRVTNISRLRNSGENLWAKIHLVDNTTSTVTINPTLTSADASSSMVDDLDSLIGGEPTFIGVDFTTEEPTVDDVHTFKLQLLGTDNKVPAKSYLNTNTSKVENISANGSSSGKPISEEFDVKNLLVNGSAVVGTSSTAADLTTYGRVVVKASNDSDKVILSNTGSVSASGLIAGQSNTYSGGSVIVYSSNLDAIKIQNTSSNYLSISSTLVGGEISAETNRELHLNNGSTGQVVVGSGGLLSNGDVVVGSNNSNKALTVHGAIGNDKVSFTNSGVGSLNSLKLLKSTDSSKYVEISRVESTGGTPYFTMNIDGSKTFGLTGSGTVNYDMSKFLQISGTFSNGILNIITK